jgi:tRNA(Arg) A34 adenosine deaminase TadA
MADFNLSADKLPDYGLVFTTESGAKCLGAIPWSGINCLVCGARAGDARRVGFDKGDQQDNWPQKSQSCTISAKYAILKDEANAILQQYVDAGGIIYTGRLQIQRQQILHLGGKK